MAVWKPKSIGVDLVDYKTRYLGIGVQHELLDTVPKKTVAQQVEDLILYGQQLQESRLALMNLPDIPENADPDDYADEINEYDDMQDVLDKAESLGAKIDAVAASQGQGGIPTPSGAGTAADAPISASSEASTEEAPPSK